MEEEAMSQGCWQPLEAGKGKELYSPLEPLEGKQPCQHLDMSLVRPILGSDWRLENKIRTVPNVYKLKCV